MINKITNKKDFLWGEITELAISSLPRGYEIVPQILIKSLCQIKLAAAIIHKKNNKIDNKIADAIIYSCRQLIDLDKDRYKEFFPLSIWQSGSGTQTNININEVIANLSCIKLGYEKNRTDIVHPNDHVNLGQSTNDSFPTAIKISTITEIQSCLIPALKILKESFEKKSKEWEKIIKCGRTHLQDAVPMTLGQEFGSYSYQITSLIQTLKDNLKLLYEIPQGGTAIGTKINSYKNFDIEVTDEISKITQLPLLVSKNKFADISSHGPLLTISGIINTCASCICKISQDITLLMSGPNCGLGEITLQSNQPGSSIMPGKVNPIHAELVKMASINAMSNHHCITQCNTLGNLQLNTSKPLIIYKMLDSIYTLSESITLFAKHGILPLKDNQEYIKKILENSSIMITALTPKIGYDKASQIILESNNKKIGIKELLLKKKLISESELEDLMDLSKLV